MTTRAPAVLKMQQPNTTKGRVVVPKRMIFFEKFQAVFDLPHFQKHILQFFSRRALSKALFKGSKSAKYFF